MYLKTALEAFPPAMSQFAAPPTTPTPTSGEVPMHPQFPSDQQPVYNGVNPNYPGVRMVCNNPPMFAVDDFLTPEECQFLIQAADDSWTPAPVVGKGSGEICKARTSSTCYLAREDVWDMMQKISALTGKPIEHCELPQVGRYLASQSYFQHFDAFNLTEEDGRRFAMNGGQRTITVLIYLNDVQQGGATHFPRLNMSIQPRQGMALVFFPATIHGVLDNLALHAALPAVDTKFISQIWIRQSSYFGQPSKRLAHTMGRCFSPTSMPAPAAAISAACVGNPIPQQHQDEEEKKVEDAKPPKKMSI